MRHNRIRDLEASILKDICKDVRVEPELLPVGDRTIGSSNTAEKARLDVSAVGIFSPMERTFADVRIVHPNSRTYAGKAIEKVYELHEKKRRELITNGLSKSKKPLSPP